MIHTAAKTQIRLDGPGRDYYQRRRAEGKTNAEAVRALKRHITTAVYRTLQADAAARAARRALASEEDKPEGWPEGAPRELVPWRSDADGNPTWGPTSRPVPQWTRPGATPVETLGRQGHHH